ncbi:hemolymph lipopolysaccharide-binding protein-like [Bacillus rossius redtenbacheri]|uniref:hemolymph lipopolysaccharide-binding protein-like n=1 Tax=Bacillus rossius redtenbacheri TaxID=93214 RepID=UPI002FDD4385
MLPVWLLVLAAGAVRHVASQPGAEARCVLARLRVEGDNREAGNWSVSVGSLQGIISHTFEGRVAEGDYSGKWKAAVYYHLKGCGTHDEHGQPHVMRTYAFHSTRSTWEDAVKTCESKGASLAFPDSEEEAKALREIFSQHHNISDNVFIENQARIGAYSPHEDGHFVMLNGKAVNKNKFIRWAEGQPDNYLQEENCVAILREGLLNDVPCWLQLPFICEK